ncbi:MAG: thioredoxin family protein [Deltaproteobacteria bacterium]|nr:thioredoxin family protein [Deltaproteobacteria bacterium]
MRSDGHPYTNQSSDRKASIRSVGLEDFDREVLKEKMPVLVLCMHRDPDFSGQLEVIHRVVTKTCGDRLKVCLLKEDSVGVFRETYGVGGTPTFLLFRGGREMSRLLGQAEPGVLKEFLSRTLSSDIGGE